MRIVLDLEDTFGDIVRKASRGTGVTVGALAMRTGIAAERLQQFLSDAGPPTEDEARAIGKCDELYLVRIRKREFNVSDLHALDVPL